MTDEEVKRVSQLAPRWPDLKHRERGESERARLREKRLAIQKRIQEQILDLQVLDKAIELPDDHELIR